MSYDERAQRGAPSPTGSDAPPEFAAVLLAAAADLVDLPAIEFDRAIPRVLVQIQELLAIDYVGLTMLQVTEQHITVAQRYTIGPTGLPAFDEFDTRFPWYAAQLLDGQPIILADCVAEYPPEAVAERAYALANGVTSSLVIPLRIGAQLVGSLNLNTLGHVHHWTPTEVTALKTLARVVSGLVQRQQTYDALQRSRDHLRMALEAATLDVWVLDVEMPQRSFSTLLPVIALPPQTTAGDIAARYLEFVHPDDRAQLEEIFNRCMRGEMESFVVEHRRIGLGEHLRWGELRGHAIRDATGKLLRLQGVTHDITARKETEAALARQQAELQRHARILEQTERVGESGGWEWDVAADSLYWTPEIYRLHGLDPADYTPQVATAVDFYAPASRSQILAAVSHALATGEPYDLRLQIVTAQGEVRWVRTNGHVERVDGQVVRLYGSLQDISRRVADEELLARQHDELVRQARIMEQTERLGEIGGWEWDVIGDKLYWTPEVYRLHGVTPDEYAPDVTTAIQFYAPESVPTLTAALEQLVDQGIPFDLKLQFITAQGKNLWVRATGNAKFADGKVQRVFGTIQDITLRTLTEEQLRQAQKMEAIGQLAGGIAHDFNNILTAINGMSELGSVYLGQVAPTPPIERVQKYLHEIRRAGERAATLTRQLLAYSRKQVLQPKPLHLGDVVTDMDTLLHRLIGQDITLTLQIAPDLGMVLADPSQIEQVLVNLAVNARDAMPQGGDLTIRLSNVRVDTPQADLSPGAYVMLQVQDTGVGMAPEVKERIFDPFFTTKEVGKGTGLGLATVHGIIYQSGGTIAVTSEVGQGATFTIWLPQIAAVAEGAPASPLQSCGGAETILVVDDEAWVRHVLRATLEMKGYTVLDAADGSAALACCAEYPATIHLLITDMLMPHMRGHALAEAARRLRPSLRVILISGYDDALVAPGDEAHFPYLTKPFATHSLLAKVRDVLDAPAP